MIHEHPLPGCTPTPLASYLKALAVLRLVAEAGANESGDPDATGFWRDDVFVLRTQLTAEQLGVFFLEHYRPTPLIAPWNGGSGFYAGDNLSGITPLSNTVSLRFAGYRQVIETAKHVIALLGLSESPKLQSKAMFLQSLRNQAPEALLRWMDAAVILSDDDPRYPPLLGTGGNDGRLDFTNNFMQRLGEVFNPASGAARPSAATQLETALFGTPGNELADRAIGQFAPGSAGGPNAASGFEGSARINPWDFILMLEGAVLFAASAARRMESADPAILVAPFTVRSRAGMVGSASANDDSDARGEIWMPLWNAPSSLDELRTLFTEGRAALAGRASRDGLDFARAVAQLGVDRGIASFQRYGFLMRSGKAYLATPLGRIPVCRNPDADLIAELEHRNWLASVQRHARDDNAPNAFRSAARQLDIALFELIQRPGRRTFQNVLRHIGRIDAALSISLKSQEAVRMPAPRLSLPWATKAQDDSSPEFNIAAALAGLRLRNANRHFVLSMRRHLAAVSETFNKDGDRNWESTSRTAVWGTRSLLSNLSALLHQRRLEAAFIGAEGELLASTVGATGADIAAFLDGETDDARVGELLAGLVCVDLHDFASPEGHSAAVPPPAFVLLKIFFTPESTLHALKLLPADRTLHLPNEIPARLASGDVETAVRIAWRSLYALGVKLPGRHPPRIVAENGPRWLAALCIPLTFAESGRLLRGLDLTPKAAMEPLPETLT